MHSELADGEIAAGISVDDEQARPETGFWIGTTLAGAVLVGALIFLVVAVFGIGRSDVSRAEVEHSISLPESATEVQALGNASSLLKLINLDRGASTILVVDRGDLPDFLGQFVWESSDGFNTLWNNGPSPAPINREFQPASVPWDVDVEPESRQCTQTTPGNADFACVWTYTVEDAGSVGIWIYSDWN